MRDRFLWEIFPALQDWKKAAESSGTKIHLYRQYNVMSWTKPPLYEIKSSPAQVVNALIEALNDKKKTEYRLPKYVMVFIDEDYIKEKDDKEYGIVEILKQELSWTIKQFKKELGRRRDLLREKRPGALSSAFEPRIIWVKMVDRSRSAANNYELRQIQALHKRFNSSLEELLHGENYMHIVNVNGFDVNNPSYTFSSSGNLTHDGKFAFWRHISSQLHLFDTHEIELLPFEEYPKENKKSLKTKQR